MQIIGIGISNKKSISVNHYKLVNFMAFTVAYLLLKTCCFSSLFSSLFTTTEILHLRLHAIIPVLQVSIYLGYASKALNY